MKILYHHRVASKDGQDVHIEEMIAAMRRLGHEVRVVAPPVSENASFGSQSGLVALIRRLLPAALYELLELAYSLIAYRRLRREYDCFSPDLVYERYNLFFLSGYWLKIRTGIPFLLEVNSPLAEERITHSGLSLKALAHWSEKKVWRCADRILPVSRPLAEHILLANIPLERIMVVHNGINRLRFPIGYDGSATRKRLGLDGKIVMGFTGFIREWHGLPLVIDAMAQMENRDQLHLLVIGEGPGLSELQEHAAKTGMASHLTCLGLLGRDEIASYVASFDIALQPKVVYYASPLKLFEYMALGRAIVAPDQPNIREILDDEKNALLFRAEDKQHFCSQIMRLCRDHALRVKLGAAACQAIEEKGFTWDENARRVLSGYGPSGRKP